MSEANGLERGAALTAKLLQLSRAQNLVEIEGFCKNSLIAAGKDKAVLETMNEQSNIKKLPDMSPGLTANQAKNFSVRFGIPESMLATQRQHWFPSNLFAGSSGSDQRLYEDVTSLDILNAPITDICLVHKSDPIPDGFYRLSKTLTNRKATLNYKSGGNEIYLCVKKDVSGTAAFVTSIIVIYPDKNEIYPPGYLVVRRGNQVCNCNTGTSAERIFICYKKEKIGNPITDLVVLYPGKSEMPPRNFYLLESSPSGIAANLNAGTGGGRVYLSYRQVISNCLCLSNEVSGSTDAIPMQGSPAQSRILALKKPSNSEYGLSTLVGHNSSAPSAITATATAVVMSANVDNSGLLSPITPKEPSIERPSPEEKTHESRNDESNPLMKSFSSNTVGSSDNERGTFSPVLPLLAEGSSAYEEGGAVDDDDNFCIMVDRRNAIVTDSCGNFVPKANRLLLLSLLAGMNVRQMEISIEVINGVLSLLNNTDFFNMDLVVVSSPQLVTMLDLTVDALCDRLDMCQKVELPLLLNFISSILNKSKGLLSQSIIRRLFISLTTLFTFHCGLSRWLIHNHQGPCLDDGAPFQEVHIMEEMIESIVKQVEKDPVAESITMSTVKETCTSESSTESFCRSLLIEFIDDVIDSVQICALCDTAQGFVATQTTNVTSQFFWNKIYDIARILYSTDAHVNSFVLLCALCRLAWPAVTVTESGSVSSRELGTKLLALDMLAAYLSSARDKMTASKVHGYQIRRLVVPCILNNISFALREPRVFTKIMKLISCMWITWRSHLRIEFANLCEQLCIRILQASVTKVRPIYQMTVLEEMEIWLGRPELMLEMFVNFDMDSKFVSHWNIFSHLIRAMCTISKRPDEVSGLTSAKSAGDTCDSSSSGKANSYIVSVRDVNIKAMEQVAHVAKTLMDATGHASLMTHDSHLRSRSVTLSGGWEQEEGDDDIVRYWGSSVTAGAIASTDSAVSEGTTTTSASEAAVVGETESEGRQSGLPPRNSTFSADHRKRRMSNVGHIKQQHLKAEELIGEAVRIYEQSSSLKKAFAFLIKKNFIANTPQEIASFLRVYKTSFDPSAIGDYLGEGGVTPAEQEYWSQIRYRYVRAISFVEMELEPALRLFLTGCGFRLPGEAQKIDRFVETFQTTYWADNHGTQNCPLKHPDTVHILTFAIIMLNTDLHRANGGTKGKKRPKMTKEEFINNLRGADKGDNIDRDYLSRIYDSIAAQPIELAVAASETEGGKSMAAATGGVGINASANANANANANQASATAQAPILEFNASGEKALVSEIARNVRDSEDLLRTLSQRTYPFSRTGIDAKLSLELVSFMFETVWLYFRDLTEVLLSDSPQRSKVDSNITLLAVDILGWSLMSAIFLGLNMEKRVLAEKLEKFQQGCVAKSVTAKQPGHALQDATWMGSVIASKPATAMEAIREVHKMIESLKEVIQETENYEISLSVAAKIEKKAKVMEKNTFFVREGNLRKQNRNGRVDLYRFFLFSDTLLYCHQAIISGEYIVHEQLPLNDMHVSDNVDDSSESSLHIDHPVKSFFLYADTPESKRAWLRDLQQTIMNCKRRAIAVQVKSSNRKLSVVDRIEEQKKQIESASTRKIKFAEDAKPDEVVESSGLVQQHHVLSMLLEEDESSIGSLTPRSPAASSSVVANSSTAVRFAVDVNAAATGSPTISPLIANNSEVNISPSSPANRTAAGAVAEAGSHISGNSDSNADEDADEAVVRMSDIELNPLLLAQAETASVASSEGEDQSDRASKLSFAAIELHEDVEHGFERKVRLQPPSNPSSPDVIIRKGITSSNDVISTPSSFGATDISNTPDTENSHTPGSVRDEQSPHNVEELLNLVAEIAPAV